MSQKRKRSVKAVVPQPEFGKQLPGIITMLLKDHRAMRVLMKKIQSKRSTPAKIIRAYETLKDLVDSHVVSEEIGLLKPLLDHPKFEDEARESYEEHRVHEYIFAGIARVKDQERRIAQMQIYCEMLEHHLKEEEHDLFPDYKAYFALSTRKKAGVKFLRKRRQTADRRTRVGALARDKS